MKLEDAGALPLLCGTCGQARHKLFAVPGAIATQCCQCGTKSRIWMRPGTIEVDFFPNEQGCLVMHGQHHKIVNKLS